MRTAIATAALAALVVLGGAGTASAGGYDGHSASNTWINDSIVTDIDNSFNTVVIFGDMDLD
ncbi:hypothetical protein [Streptomyces sp. H27-D2]|uniref:hypothetical protein n=1 Tax=Streptomyces sp. H27-D2 TaxID=3046304 RepID=UPI002DBB176A|nr:hypothetical protein [Streptomyces sp. H27-D2]MEC4016358.1 hypothetical protein [Streptomyces sp. H27-D2]